MTEGVGAELVGGDREVALLFFGTAGPQGADGARAQRSPWRDGTTGRGAVSETELSTPLIRCRVSKGARKNTVRIGGTRCASWVG